MQRVPDEDWVEGEPDDEGDLRGEGPGIHDLHLLGDEEGDPCPHCGREAYEGTGICPHCGEDMDQPPVWSPESIRQRMIGSIAIIVIVGFILTFVFLRL